MQSRSIHAENVVASGAVTKRRFVGFDGAQASVQGQKVLGVSQYDAADGDDLALDAIGTTVVETGAAIAKGDSIITDAQGRAIPATGALSIGAGATPVTSTAADGAILTGADLPEFVVGDALAAASGAGKFIEIIFRR
ncbi:MAG: capsid cement protein [Pseudomonadota bacterium]